MRVLFIAGALFTASILYSSVYSQNQAHPNASSFSVGGLAGAHPWVGGTVKYWFSDFLAIDGAIGFEGDLHMHADITYNRQYFNFPRGDMNVVLGGGIYTEFPADFDFGIQGVGGVEWFMPWAPWGVFAHYYPAFNFLFAVNDTWFFEPWNLVVGARYYF